MSDKEPEIDYEELFLCLLMGLCDIGLDELVDRAIAPLFMVGVTSRDWRYYASVELGNTFSHRKWMAQKIEYRICDVFISEMQAQSVRGSQSAPSLLPQEEREENEQNAGRG
jgi:hypothetical protein